ncbi:MAG: hypothetical protein WKF97_12835 [Chitinophagaceae bacterium]
MKLNSIILIITAIVLIACDKNKFETRPQLKIKSINGNVVPLGGVLIVRLEYTDKEGDLGQDTLVSIRNRLNRRPLPSGRISVDTLFNSIPEFPDKNKGEFEVKFQSASYLRQSDIENDTILFKFIAKDRGGNNSDTVSTEKIVVLRQ